MTAAVAGKGLRLAFLGDPNSIHTRRWLTFFADRGHEIHLLVPSADPAIEPGLDSRVAVRRFVAWPRVPIPGAGALVTALSLRLALRAIRPDVLHAHYLGRYGWAARLSGFRPYVVTVWGSDVFVAPATSERARAWGRRALASAALVTAVSDDLLEAAIELGAHPERARIVQFGVDPARFSPGPAPEHRRAALGLGGRRVVLSPRAMRPLYRHEVVIEAVAQLPADVALVLVEWQPDRAYAEALRARAAALGLADRVRFVPGVAHEELPDLYRLADVVVSVPRTDAFPVTALEAMATGIPVVLADLPSAHEGLDAVDPDAIVPGANPAAVAAAIRARLELAPPDRAALGARLRAAAIERGDATRSLLSMEDCYRTLAQRERATVSRA